MTTPQEFQALLAQFAAASAAHKAGGPGDLDERFRAAFAAIRSARPTDPAAMAMQLRFLLDHAGPDDDDKPVLEHIVAQLEAMGAPPA
jgi:hypothetical protein